MTFAGARQRTALFAALVLWCVRCVVVTVWGHALLTDLTPLHPTSHMQDIKGGTVLMAMTLEAVRTLDPVLFDSTAWHLWFDAAEERGCADFAVHCRDQVRQKEDVEAMLVFEFDLTQGAGMDGAPQPPQSAF